MVEHSVSWQVLGPGSPSLAPSSDPARSRSRLDEAVLDPDASTQRSTVLELLDAHGASLADRGTTPAHLTGSAIVVDPSSGRVAVLLHAKLRRWLQPGGHADGDHELAGVALREAVEETGLGALSVVLPAIDLDVHRVDHGDPLGAHLHLDLRFVVIATPDAVLVGNHESLDIRWVSVGELEQLVDEPRLVQVASRALQVLASIEGPIS